MQTFSQGIFTSSVALLALLVIMGLAYTVWSQMAMKKKRKYFERLHADLATGQQIVFCGGIFGTIASVSGERITVRVRSGAEMDISRYAVQEIVKK